MKFPADGSPELQGKQADIKHIKNVGNMIQIIEDRVKGTINRVFKAFQHTGNMETHLSKHISINQLK